MAKFLSKSVKVNAPKAEVHTYLQNMANIQRLLPLDKISNWSNTDDSCSFKIQNVYTIELKRIHAVLNENDAETTFETTDKSPFPFVLKAKLKSKINAKIHKGSIRIITFFALWFSFTFKKDKEKSGA